MRILFVAKRHYTKKDLFFDRFGRLYHLPRVLSERGHKVEVVALDYRTRKKEAHRDGNLHLRSEPSGTGGLFVSRRSLVMSCGEEADLIIGTGHLHIATHALRLARRHGIPFVFEAYDYYPAFLPQLARPIGVAWFRRLCRQAAGCVAASWLLGDLMMEINSRTIVVENGYDPRVFRKRSQEKSKKKLGLDPAFRYVCFIGSATEALGFGDFLNALDIIREHHPDVRGLHAGYRDPSFADHEACISLGACDQDGVAEVMSASSCGVVPYRDSLQVKYSNSCKLVEYMATGLPVVATKTGDNERILGSAYPGLIDSSAPEHLARAIIGQLRSPMVPKVPDAWTWDVLGETFEKFVVSLAK